MYRETITCLGDEGANGIADLWNEAIGDMLTSLRTDITDLKDEGTAPQQVKEMEETERTLYRLDSGEQKAGPRELLDAVQGWLAYWFRYADEPTLGELAPVYRLASVLAETTTVLWRSGAPTTVAEEAALIGSASTV
jgi:hypothetical protein